jgi:phosphoglycolate phosphatase-like HAD superfamily hydrolase
MTEKVLDPEEQQNLYQRFEEVERKVGREVSRQFEQLADDLARLTSAS